MGWGWEKVSFGSRGERCCGYLGFEGVELGCLGAVCGDFLGRRFLSGKGLVFGKGVSILIFLDLEK